MKSIKNIDYYPAGLPLVADDLIEFHASRILLLIYICGTKDQSTKLKKIDGLTKLAKLDFFVRYPEYFLRIAKFLEIVVENIRGQNQDSQMIRFHYGPWDKRYYQVIPYLEARRLILVDKQSNTYNFFLTGEGERLAQQFSVVNEFGPIVDIMQNVKVLKKYNGSQLKNFIYRVFENEVKSKKLNELIR